MTSEHRTRGHVSADAPASSDPERLVARAGLAALLAVLTSAGHAQDQVTPPEPSPEVAALQKKADELWDQAIAAYNQGAKAEKPLVAQQHFADAIALFDEIVKLGKASGKYGVAAFHAALVCRGAGEAREADAIRRFER